MSGGQEYPLGDAEIVKQMRNPRFPCARCGRQTHAADLGPVMLGPVTMVKWCAECRRAAPGGPHDG